MFLPTATTPQRSPSFARSKLTFAKSKATPRNLSAVLASLAEMDIQSILVEGGSEVAGTFCDAKLVDKVTFLMAPIIIGGADAPVAIGGKGAASIDDAIKPTDIETTVLGEDLEITGYPE